MKLFTHFLAWLFSASGRLSRGRHGWNRSKILAITRFRWSSSVARQRDAQQSYSHEGLNQHCISFLLKEGLLTCNA
jgi:hypothetical protein